MITDHRPLCDMFKKPLTEVHNARLQRLVEKTMDFNLAWTHLKGDRNVIADLFSRTGLATADAPEFPRTSNVAVKQMTKGAGKRTVCREMEVLAIQARDDNMYQQLLDALRQERKVTEYPNNHEMRDFFGVWDKLGIEETRAGPLITVDGRLMVPEVARKKILENLHRCHPGKPTMMANARHLYWWPGMKSEVVSMCEACDVCSLHARSRMSGAPQQQEDISCLAPMDLVSLDLHNYGGRVYLSGQDRASGFRWCERLKNQSSSEVIKFVDKIQKLYGKITYIRSDNGPCFRGPFQAYLEEVGVAFKPSSSFNPESNACAESAVRLNKLLQAKTACSDKKLQEYMLWANCLMRPDNSGSPAELFFRRNMKVSGVPRCTIGEVDFERIQALREEAVALRKNKDTTRHYRGSFKVGDNVILQDSQSKQWNQRGTIVSERECIEPGSSRSYLIDVGQPQLKLRNRKYLRLSCRKIQPAERISWDETSPVGEEQLLQTRKQPGQRKVRFIDEGQ